MHSQLWRIIENGAQLHSCIDFLPSSKSSTHSNVISNWKDRRNGQGLSLTTTLHMFTLAIFSLFRVYILYTNTLSPPWKAGRDEQITVWIINNVNSIANSAYECGAKNTSFNTKVVSSKYCLASDWLNG